MSLPKVKHELPPPDEILRMAEKYLRTVQREVTFTDKECCPLGIYWYCEIYPDLKEHWEDYPSQTIIKQAGEYLGWSTDFQIGFIRGFDSTLSYAELRQYNPPTHFRNSPDFYEGMFLGKKYANAIFAQTTEPPKEFNP